MASAQDDENDKDRQSSSLQSNSWHNVNRHTSLPRVMCEDSSSMHSLDEALRTPVNGSADWSCKQNLGVWRGGGVSEWEEPERPLTPSQRGRGGKARPGDVEVKMYTSEKGITYKTGDYAYLHAGSQNYPYCICTIQGFKPSRRYQYLVHVKWFYRHSEVPETVYQPLMQDRANEYSNLVTQDPVIKARELFISDVSDTYPVSSLRGKCSVTHYTDICAARDFKPTPDTFFYILGYNPETKRLATTQGEIRVGSCHQARLPPCAGGGVHPDDMPERCADWEVITWKPAAVVDSDLVMYLRAARSMAAFAGMCDGGSTEDGCTAASMDETTISALNMLHDNEYDTQGALQALVKSINPKSIEKRWSEDDAKKFVKGLRTYGKNFFQIRTELLPCKETGDLVEYYYFWKKTPAAANTRPHRRHRRGFRSRQQRTPRPPSNEDVDSVDVSSASDVSEDDESDGGGGARHAYFCRHCDTTKSRDWHHSGKAHELYCRECRLYYQKYGCDRPLAAGSGARRREVRADPPQPFLFRPVQQDADSSSRQDGGVSSPDPGSPLSLLLPNTFGGRKTPDSIDSDGGGSNNPFKKHLHQDSESDSVSSKHKRRASESESFSDTSSVYEASSTAAAARAAAAAQDAADDADDDTNQDDVTSSTSSSVASPADQTTGGGGSSKPPYIKPDPDAAAAPTTNGFGSGSREVKAAAIKSEPVSEAGSSEDDEGTSDSSSSSSSDDDDDDEGSDEGGDTSGGDAAVATAAVSAASSGSGATHTQVTALTSSSSVLPSVTTTSVKLELGVASAAPPVASSSVSATAAAVPVIQATPASATIKQEPGVSTAPAPAYRLDHKLYGGGGGGSAGSPHSVLSTSTVTVASTGGVRPEVPPPLAPLHATQPGGPGGAPRGVMHLPPPPGLPGPPPPLVTAVPLSAAGHAGPVAAAVVKSEPGVALPPPPDPAGVHRTGSPQPRPRSRSPLTRPPPPAATDSDSDSEPPRTDEPPSTIVNTECHRSKNAIFIKHWSRGWNSCSRTDFEFRPTPDSWIAKKRENRLPVRPAPAPATRSPAPASAAPAPLSGAVIKQEERVRDDGRNSAPGMQMKKSDTPPENRSADAQITSALMASPSQHLPPYGRLSPGPPRAAYPGAAGHLGPDPTPALRQLSEYARPHMPGADPSRSLPYSLGSAGLPPPPHPSMAAAMDPYFRMASMFPPGSRERLELELDREKRERDAREREIRERELREIEIREKLKAQELEMKPPGFDRLPPPGAMDPHWAELQRRYGGMPPPPPGHLPGVYPPTSLASDLLSRERERFDRLNELRSLGLPVPGAAGVPGLPDAAAERLSLEQRLHVERLMAGDPMLRLQMAGNTSAAAVAAAAAAAQHTHTHAHTHLHLHQPDGGGGPGQPPAGLLAAGLHHAAPASLASNLEASQKMAALQSERERLARGGNPHHHLGADPLSSQSAAAAAAASSLAAHLAAVGGGGPPGGGGGGIPPGHPLLEAARQQELVYRELLSRPPYSTDPVLAHQLTAQANAHQEQLQRQLVLERERLAGAHTPGGAGAGMGPPPPH